MAADEGVDDVLDAVGFGLWQIPVFLLTILVQLVLPVHSMGSALMSAPLEFKCSTTNNDLLISLQLRYSNTTEEGDNLNTAAPLYDSKCLDSSTYVFPKHENSSEGVGHYAGLPSCPWVFYDHSIFTSSVISEYDLICEREMLRPLFQMMYSVGAIIGGFIGGQISDSFGRKRAVQIGSVLSLVSTIFLYFSPQYAVTLLLRVILGGSCNFMILPIFSLALEITPAKHRTAAGMLLGIANSAGIIFLGVSGFYMRVWQELMILNGATPFIFILPLIFFIDESPRWLIQHGRSSEALRSMTKAAKKNKANSTDVFTQSIEKLRENSTKSPTEDAEKGTGRNLWSSCQAMCSSASYYFKSVAMRIILTISPLIWVFQGCLYLGVILNANNFTSNDPFIYVAVSGVMDMTAILLSTPLSMRIGRRKIIFGCLFVGGVLFMLDLVVPETLHWLKFVLVMTALNLVAASFQINFLYSPELYPTLLRTRGLALSCFACNIGFLVAPVIVDLLAPLAGWSVSVSFGLGGLLASILVLFLPETRNKPLPETVMDVDKRHQDTDYCIKRKKKETETDNGISEVNPEESELQKVQ